MFPPSPFSKLNNIAKVPLDLPLTSRLRNKRALRKSGSRVPFHIPRKGQKDTLIKFSSRATIATDVLFRRENKGWNGMVRVGSVVFVLAPVFLESIQHGFHALGDFEVALQHTNYLTFFLW